MVTVVLTVFSFSSEEMHYIIKKCISVTPKRGASASRRLFDHAEPVAERIAAKCGGGSTAPLEFPLALRARTQCPFQKAVEVLDVKIDMDRRPVPLVPAHVIRARGWFAAGRLFDDSDPAVTAFENHIGRDRACDLG